MKDSGEQWPSFEAEQSLREDYLRQTVIENRYVPWVPNPKQAAFLTEDSAEMLYGGAAGGGKSVALLMAALQFASVPGYSALLLRRTFADLNLPDALIPLSHQWLQGTDATWDGQKHQWRLPNNVTIQFGYLETEIDKYRYQGAAFQFIGFDELTQFTKSQYSYLHSRLRRAEGLEVPIRMRAASNPGGVGHDWVKERFISPGRDGALFVPARLEDNPRLDVASYEESLSRLDHITRQQLRFGDWNIRADAGNFKSEWFRYYGRDDAGEHYVLGSERRHVRIDACSRFAVADIAGTEAKRGNDPDWTVIEVWDIGPRGEMILVYQWRGQFEIPDVEERLVEVSRRYELPYLLVEKNGIGLGVVQTVKRRGLAVRPILAKGTKIARSQVAQIRMEAGSVYFPAGVKWVDELESELLTFPTDGVHDDQVDCVSHAARHVQKLFNVLPDSRDIAHSESVEAKDNAELVEIEKAARLESYDEESAWQEI